LGGVSCLIGVTNLSFTHKFPCLPSQAREHCLLRSRDMGNKVATSVMPKDISIRSNHVMTTNNNLKDDFQFKSPSAFPQQEFCLTEKDISSSDSEPFNVSLSHADSTSSNTLLSFKSFREREAENIRALLDMPTGSYEFVRSRSRCHT
jgi:hypothetical protein